MGRQLGFIVDKNLPALAKILNQNGIECLFLEGAKDSEQICLAAVKHNKIFVTSNLKLFNKKISQQRFCVHFRSNPQCKLTPFIRLV